MLEIKSLNRPNFNTEEFIHSDTAIRLGIDNTPKDINLIYNGMVLADKMQEVRKLLNKPIKISSGYRCLELNRKIGSKDNSQHIQFQACDFTSSFGTPEQIVRFLKENKVEVDQCLIEFNSWVHLSIKPKDNRNQFAFLDKKGFRLL